MKTYSDVAVEPSAKPRTHLKRGNKRKNENSIDESKWNKSLLTGPVVGPPIPGAQPMLPPTLKPYKKQHSTRFTKRPGDVGFNKQLTSIMRQRGLYTGGEWSTGCVAPKGKGFAHQESAAWIVGPESPVNRLLVVHRTGSGKTNVMVRVLNEYFFDERSKIVIFPNTELVRNFYEKFYASETRYTEYAAFASQRDRRANTLANFKERMAMKGHIHRSGRLGELAAPIRPIRYSIAGGSTVISSRGPQLPIFKRGASSGNPYDNKIIIMDEVHNLVQPPPGTDARMIKKLAKLRHALYTAKGSVIVGLTATPIVKNANDGKELLRIIKGREYASAQTDEGFISYFNALPSSIYPIALPDTQAIKVIRVPLIDENLKRYMEKDKQRKLIPKLDAESFKTFSSANVKNKEKLVNSIWGLMNYCNMAGYYTQANSAKFASGVRKAPAAYATKLDVIANEAIKYPHKCAILIHRKLGFQALKRVIKTKMRGDASRFAFMGKPKSLKEQRDNPILSAFNNKDTNGRGEKIKCLVLDADFYGEGIDLIGVRKFIIAHPAPNYAAYKQWVGRVFRSCAYTYLRPNERNVQVDMYVAKIPSGEKTADEIMLHLLRAETMEMEKALRQMFALPAADRKVLGHP